MRTTTEHHWTDTTGRAWAVSLSWLTIAGRLECVGIEVRAPDLMLRPVPATVLREVPIGRMIDEGRSLAPAKALAEEVIGELPAEHATFSGRVKRPLTTREYLRFRSAVVYSRAWVHHDPAPVKCVMRDFDPPLARSTAGRYIEEARNELGYLEPTEQRRQNGELTKKARKILAKFGDDWTEWEAAIAAHEQGKG